VVITKIKVSTSKSFVDMILLINDLPLTQLSTIRLKMSFLFATDVVNEPQPLPHMALLLY
jgi:hypothetical protein